MVDDSTWQTPVSGVSESLGLMFATKVQEFRVVAMCDRFCKPTAETNIKGEKTCGQYVSQLDKLLSEKILYGWGRGIVGLHTMFTEQNI